MIAGAKELKARAGESAEEETFAASNGMAPTLQETSKLALSFCLR